MARKDAAAIARLPQQAPSMAGWRDAGPKWWEEVAEKKDELRAADQVDPGRLAALYEQARVERDELTAKHKEEMRPVSIAEAALYQLICETFAEAEGEILIRTQKREGVKGSGGHTVSTSPDIMTAVVDSDAMVAWMKANGYERKLTLPAPAVKAITVERFRAGDEIPEGVELRGTFKVNFRKV